MLDHHGGFFILRDDPEVAAIARKIVGDYLADTDQEVGAHDLLWFGRTGLGALLLIITEPDHKPDESAAKWTAANRGLAARIARAVSAPVWAYTYNNRLGNETIAEFNAAGTLKVESSTQWDDGNRLALDELASELEVPRVLIEYDLPFGAPPFRLNTLDAFDLDGFVNWLGTRGPVKWPGAGSEVTLHLLATAAAELTEAAATLGVRRGDLIDAMWESTKVAIYGSIPMVEHDHLDTPDAFMKAPPARDTPFVMPAAGPPSGPLDHTEQKIAVRLVLGDGTIREMQELALIGDRSQSYVLQKTYAIARDRLLAAVNAAG